MRRLARGALLLMVALGLAGCVKVVDDLDTVLYESQAGEFEIRVPTEWQAEPLATLISGVKFTTTAAGGNTLRFWVLFGPASGRTANEIIDDIESLRALLVESGTTLSDWSQEADISKTIDGLSGREVAYAATVSGWDVLGLAWAVTDGTHDYVILAEAGSGVYNDFEGDFIDAVASFSRI